MDFLRYAAAFVVPVLAFWSLSLHGVATFVGPFVLFGLLPLAELVLPRSHANPDAEEEAARLAQPGYDVLLWLAVPVQVAAVVALGERVARGDRTPLELVGNVLSVGLSCGALGINVAHELGHRVRRFDRALAHVLLATSLYLHFFVEHNRGHHKRVATPEDPATARRGEALYPFLVRTIVGSWRSAWSLEAARLAKSGRSAWSFSNALVVYALVQLAIVAAFAAAFGPLGAACFVGAAFAGVLLLENVNYVEHYGLQRARRPDGGYERVLPRHSWNSEHPLGRLMLFELTRHSDHHAVASRPYAILRHHDEAPSLPAGYPATMVLSWCPPLFFRILDPRVDAVGAAPASEIA